MALQPYNYEVVYRKRSMNWNADGLSRQVWEEKEEEKEETEKKHCQHQQLRVWILRRGRCTPTSLQADTWRLNTNRDNVCMSCPAVKTYKLLFTAGP